MPLSSFLRWPRRNSLRPQSLRHLGLLALFLGSTTLAQWGSFNQAAQAQSSRYCIFSTQESAQKERLRQTAMGGDRNAQRQYQTLIQQHGQSLAQCRQRGGWPKTQAIWVRLYPCDANPGVLEQLLDHIVNKGYNEVYIEVFSDSQVLLPAADNPTPWVSVVRTPGQEKTDLLALALDKGRERGLKMYAWLFTMNFGYAYGVRPDRQQAIARNGRGQTSIDVVPDGSQAFVDPYNRQAQTDYYTLVREVLERRPDGVLFDYIRYPRGTGGASVASSVKDLWVHGPSARQALVNRGTNEQGRALIQRFLNQGRITSADIRAVRSQFPNESSPQWQGRNSTSYGSELWKLSVAHAAQGVIDFLNLGSRMVLNQRIPAGAVFFPHANRSVGQGYDSRLQPWDRFSPQLEWHAMSYAVCNGTQCIVDEVQRVLDEAQPGTRVVPALAGQWGRVYNQHPPLETQMTALQRAFPNLQAVSHFAYGWQEPQNTQARRACRF
ncbi:MAG: family 10 glycosylhydrolase [Spirulina sp. SIO3F2]|nr:family 10 glycosylhydrolase [Spirulina sp. SIO3F2]